MYSVVGIVMCTQSDKLTDTYSHVQALENELRAFHADKELRGEHVISWNHTEFELRYETLAEEVKIGDHYLRLLLEDDPKSTKIHNAPEFFNDLYHRFLLTTVPAMKAMCLQALAVVYGQCFEDIGGFNDTEYIVTMLNRCEDHMERDRLLEFLCVLLKHRRNVKLFIDAGGLRCLVDMVTLVRLACRCMCQWVFMDKWVRCKSKIRSCDFEYSAISN